MAQLCANYPQRSVDAVVVLQLLMKNNVPSVTNTQRASNAICVVERPQDIEKIELTGAFDGTYHVLGGALSPLEGIGPENLRIRELLERLKKQKRLKK